MTVEEGKLKKLDTNSHITNKSMEKNDRWHMLETESENKLNAKQGKRAICSMTWVQNICYKSYIHSCTPSSFSNFAFVQLTAVRPWSLAGELLSSADHSRHVGQLLPLVLELVSK